MKRRLFNIVAGVSAALCVATMLLWLQSYWRYEQVTVVRWPSYYRLHILNGRVSLEYTTDYPFPLSSGWALISKGAALPTISDTVPISDRQGFPHMIDLENGNFQSFSVLTAVGTQKGVTTDLRS